MLNSAEALEDSIHKLGFDPRDIKFLLITHAHIDHAGPLAHFVKLSGGSAVVMDRDFEQLKVRSILSMEHDRHSTSRRLRPSES
jgi:metallo-beta-lactamase class B